MARARYYSPQLDRDLVTSLYHAAQARRIPMTRLASSLVRWAYTWIRDGDLQDARARAWAELATAEAQPRRALRLAGAAASLREKHGTPLAPSSQARLERTLELVREAFRGEDAVVAWSEGQAMTLEQAMAYALSVE